MIVDIQRYVQWQVVDFFYLSQTKFYIELNCFDGTDSYIFTLQILQKKSRKWFQV